MKKTLLIIIIPVFLFLLLNIYYSQQISPIFNGLINDDRKTIVKFLKDIRHLKEYDQIRAANTDIFGEDLNVEINSVVIKRNKSINELKALLEKNPRSRDVLFGLYLLYQDEGNNVLANQYLIKAKEIDPNLK